MTGDGGKETKKSWVLGLGEEGRGTLEAAWTIGSSFASLEGASDNWSILRRFMRSYNEARPLNLGLNPTCMHNDDLRL